MKHALVQSIVAGIILLGAQAAARADMVTVTPTPGSVRDSAAADERVDADATMSVSPGEGAGVFVQYASGGHWNVFTSCDTNRSDRPCRFDIVILPVDSSVSISGPQGQQLEPVDVLTLGSDGSIRLQTGTAGRLDGVSFDADPGATMRVDVLLDGEARPDFVNWVSDGEQRQGTAGNPVDFKPSSP